MAPPPAHRASVPRGSAGASNGGLHLAFIFSIFAAANSLAAVFSPIQDCDEVFNYWEPTHYLNHGYGLQTWEYSPEFAIRSWAYTGLHAGIIHVGRLLPFGSKRTEFYFLRIVLSLVCALCETRFYSAIAKALHPRVAFFFLITMVSSPGMYHAATAYLPSSFAMYTAMLAFSSFMDRNSGVGSMSGTFWFACGALLGWPFAGALIAPFVIEQLLAMISAAGFYPGIRKLLSAAIRCLILLILQTAVDSYFYKKLVCVPLNIVLYNVFSGGSRGPNIYGVEPWHFYLRNLALNFTAWFPLGLAALPLLLLHRLSRQKPILQQTLFRSTILLTPFYLWLGIFTLQPHKEERFMYPAYPALALNASVSFHVLLSFIGTTDHRSLLSKIPVQLKLVVVMSFVMATLNLGALRILGLMTGYSAPLHVYPFLQQPQIAAQGSTVCIGKEWYRFPSSYFLPNHMRAKFIKSEFSGLLPGEFSEAEGPGHFPGTWRMPSGMNDENREDPGKYTNIIKCDYLIDSRFSGLEPSALEPDYIADSASWERVTCGAFLDHSQTPLLGRLIWVPDLPFVPERYRRRWGEYCLLKRRRDTKINGS
ncbi:asparagine-linked glycosylation 9 protein isoform a [Westerdykella ornata]|uniref:Mannosyltransferase n=1 Tax=Westerdykella ornata TaxID=318751 RepID=A0A6A6JE23_WESOR|nr:asparagine-linked glycosylation 9 protein isoform a [Westerdykella ornata]KAF2274811.1 asparagine-linked glycosylation 9 protein isoform a [Westerdykella ornata]